MTIKIRHTGLVVSNLERALIFWRDIIGFTVERIANESGPHIDAMMGLKGVDLTTVKMSDQSGAIIELLHFKSHPDEEKWMGQPFSTGFTHIALTVDDIDRQCQKLRDFGVQFPAEPQYSPDGLVRVIYCTAPEGILLELVQVIS